MVDLLDSLQHWAIRNGEGEGHYEMYGLDTLAKYPLDYYIYVMLISMQVSKMVDHEQHVANAAGTCIDHSPNGEYDEQRPCGSKTFTRNSQYRPREQGSDPEDWQAKGNCPLGHNLKHHL